MTRPTVDTRAGVALVRREAARAASVSGERLRVACRDVIVGSGDALGVRSAVAGLADVTADLAGSGAALRELWRDPATTDVLVNGPTEVWVDRGEGLRRVELDVGDVRRLATRLAAAAGQRLDDAAPVADGRLPDGVRLHAVLAPIAAGGACVSLRRHVTRALGLAEWHASGGLGPLAHEVLGALVDCRANVLVSGGTGTGKTTLLAAMLSRAPGTERIVCIEEARELAPRHPHVVHLQARAPNVQGAGGVSLTDLVRAAMRMRPDRLVLGECRGAEVREVLLALNTGHDGGMATVHANAAPDVPARLQALGSLAGMTPAAVAVQAVSAFDAVVHVVRRGGVRLVEQIAVLDLDEGRLRARLALVRPTGAGDLVPSAAWDVLARRLERGAT